MNQGINKVMLMGTIEEEPTLRELENSTMLRLRLVTTTRYLDREKELKEITQWHTVVAWGEPANRNAAMLHKGDTIFIEGELRNRKYEKKEKKYFITEVRAREIQLLHAANDNTIAQAA